MIVCLVLALSLLPVLMKATAFITEMKSMQYNVSGAKELLDMEILDRQLHVWQLRLV